MRESYEFGILTEMEQNIAKAVNTYQIINIAFSAVNVQNEEKLFHKFIQQIYFK